MKSRILVIDDNPTMREGIFEVVTRMGHNVVSSSSGDEGLRLFKNDAFDFVILDLKMSGMDGLEVLKKIKELRRDTVVMMMTAYGKIETAVEAMKLGAFDFITKPFTPDLLRLKVVKALEMAKANKENTTIVQESLSEKVKQKAYKIVGGSPAMKKVMEEIRKAASSGSAVLISGENGTGKELVAREIHVLSVRSGKPFIKIDPLAPAEDIETLLFGGLKEDRSNPAFRRKSAVEIAQGGTLFFEEISLFPLQIQNKLLKLIKDKGFERPLSGETVKADLRIIASISKDIEDEVSNNSLSRDLYYKLKVTRINLPRLSERDEDIEELSKYLITKACKDSCKKLKRFSKKAIAILRSYNWPGNVSELESVVETCALSGSTVITPKDLPLSVLRPDLTGKVPAYTGLPLAKYLDDIERNLIETALKENHGIKTRTAKKLGIKTSLLYYKLEKYGLNKIES